MNKPAAQQPRYQILQKMATWEGFLVQLIGYLLFWLIDGYVGMMVSLIFGGIAFFIGLLSVLVEVVDRSSVPRVYYRFILLSLLAPVLAAALGMLIG